MGLFPSRPYVEEKEIRSWKDSHSLQIDERRQKEQHNLLDKFQVKLYLCYSESQVSRMPFKYKQYFLTDSIQASTPGWTMEFLLDEGHVDVYPNKDGRCYVRVGDFEKTPEVRERMQKVCGARGYSMGLRNSEHLARYVKDGAWFSEQMCANKTLRKWLTEQMPEKTQEHINRLPAELQASEEIKGMFSPDFYSGFVTHNPNLEPVIDSRAYNVLLLGPSGKGKSTIGNLMFGKSVFRTGIGAKSITREINFASGQAKFPDYLGKDPAPQPRRVNVIDTVGLCDSSLSDADAIDLIQRFLNAEHGNVMLDRVVIVCGDRVEKHHANGVQQVLKWLKYSEAVRRNFLFLYNKADPTYDSSSRLLSLQDMCDVLSSDGMKIEPEFFEDDVKQKELPSESLPSSTGQSSLRCPDGDGIQRPLVMATGFPPTLEFDCVKQDLCDLLDAVFVQTLREKGGCQPCLNGRDRSGAFEPGRIQVGTSCSVM